LKTQQNKFWLQTNVNDVLEPMILACCQKGPDDKIAFMLEYMEQKFGERATKGDKQHLNFLRSEVSRLEAQMASMKANTQGTTDDDQKEQINSEDETDSDVSTFEMY
jgi:hypothetical protein